MSVQLRRAGYPRGVMVTLALLLAGALQTRADASLLVEDPFGRFGEVNPTGHAAIYLDHVCAETPTRLRPCGPGETGVVLSRYHHVAGYDWLAIPVLAYLYAVDEARDLPVSATLATEADLRDAYRRRALRALAPDLPNGRAPGGEWIQLIGAAYDRTIHGFRVHTSAQQDEQLIALFNDQRNVSQFNLLFRNCADLSRTVLDLYYPHAVGRSYLADFGFTTPKHIAERLTRYAAQHPEAQMSVFVLPQVPGSIERSTPIRGVAESLVKSKKYLIPLAVLHPEITGGLVAAYVVRGRYRLPNDAMVLDAASFAPSPAPDGLLRRASWVDSRLSLASAGLIDSGVIGVDLVGMVTAGEESSGLDAGRQVRDGRSSGEGEGHDRVSDESASCGGMGRDGGLLDADDGGVDLCSLDLGR